MRQIVIVISDLYLHHDDSGSVSSTVAAAASPGLEEVARFGRKASVDGGWRSWLGRWLDRDDLAGVAPAAIAMAASPEITRGGTVWLANPVHFIAGLTNLHLDYRGLLDLPEQDLAALAEDFTRTFGDTEFSLRVAQTGAFLLRSPRAVDVVTTEPSRAVAQGVEPSLPAGPDAAILKRFGAELEMWLHSHPINEARARRGELPVSTLWPWGGGVAIDPISGPSPAFRMVFGSDPFLPGLAHLCGMTLRPLPQRLPDPAPWPDTQRALLVAQITPLLCANPGWTMFEALAHLDSCFIMPAIEAVRAGTAGGVLVVANDMQLCFGRRDRWRFWRRRPQSRGASLFSPG